MHSGPTSSCAERVYSGTDQQLRRLSGIDPAWNMPSSIDKALKLISDSELLVRPGQFIYKVEIGALQASMAALGLIARLNSSPSDTPCAARSGSQQLANEAMDKGMGRRRADALSRRRAK